MTRFTKATPLTTQRRNRAFQRSVRALCLSGDLDWKTQRHIGGGAHGKVDAVRLRASPTSVAVKNVVADSFNRALYASEVREVAAQRALVEAEVSGRTQHRWHFVPQFLAAEIKPYAQTQAVSPDGMQLARLSSRVALELMDGDLRNRLARGPIDRVTRARIILQVVGALNILHALSISHRDVKPANILLSGERAVLTDLGNSRFGSCPGVTTVVTGRATSLWWCPPEVVVNSAPTRVEQSDAATAADIWAVGICLFEMLAGSPDALRPMFNTDTEAEQYVVSRRLGKMRLASLRADAARRGIAMHEGEWAFLCELLQTDHHARPTAREVFKHPYLADARSWLATQCRPVPPTIQVDRPRARGMEGGGLVRCHWRVFNDTLRVVVERLLAQVNRPAAASVLALAKAKWLLSDSEEEDEEDEDSVCVFGLRAAHFLALQILRRLDRASAQVHQVPPPILAVAALLLAAKCRMIYTPPMNLLLPNDRCTATDILAAERLLLEQPQCRPYTEGSWDVALALLHCNTKRQQDFVQASNASPNRVHLRTVFLQPQQLARALMCDERIEYRADQLLHARVRRVLKRLARRPYIHGARVDPSMCVIDPRIPVSEWW